MNMYILFYELEIGQEFSYVTVPVGEVKGKKINPITENGFKYNCIIYPKDGNEYYHFMVANDIVKIV